MTRKICVAMASALVLTLSGCTLESSANKPASTLYRNSPLDYGSRVHFATFDADDSQDFNMQNCAMTARVLNSNMDAANKVEGNQRDPRLGFWCELGQFNANGSVPQRFESEFPSDVRTAKRW